MPDRRRFGRTPDTILLLTALTLAAGVVTIARQAPASVLEIVPLWAALVWSGTLAVGAAVALAGVLWRDELWGWGLELSGRIAVAGTCAAYGWALWSTATTLGSSLLLGLVVGIAIASVVRVWQLVRRWQQFLDAVRRQERQR